MDKWEYAAIDELIICASWEVKEEVEKRLNKYGAEGWVLVSREVTTGGGGFPFLSATFQRKIEEETE